MSNTFRVTTKHIDDWYKENRWWVDDLSEDEKVRLCEMFYVYQILEMEKDNNLVIQSELERKELVEHLKSKILSSVTFSTTFTTLPTPLPSKEYIHPFYSTSSDIKRVLKTPLTTKIITIITSVPIIPSIISLDDIYFVLPTITIKPVITLFDIDINFVLPTPISPIYKKKKGKKN